MIDSCNAAFRAASLGIKGDSGSVSTSPSASTAKGGTFSTGSFIAGLLTGLAVSASLLSLVSSKGKRSDPRRSGRPKLYYERPLVPPSTLAVDGHDNEGMTDVTLPSEPTTQAPAGAAKRKLTDEDVETIRAMKAAGKPVKEIATLYGVSPKTIYARLKKAKSNNQNETNDGREKEE